jgi:hypothetical protein
VVVFQAGEYEDQVPGNSTFEEGDWNGDGDFTTSDFVFVLQAGTYVAESIIAPHSLVALAGALTAATNAPNFPARRTVAGDFLKSSIDVRQSAAAFRALTPSAVDSIFQWTAEAHLDVSVDGVDSRTSLESMAENILPGRERGGMNVGQLDVLGPRRRLDLRSDSVPR